MKLLIINSVFVLLSISCSDKTAVDKKQADEFKPFTADSARADFAKGNYRMITYGLEVLLDDEYPSKRDSLAKAYGFYFDNQGCIVEENSHACADEYNFTMEILLQKVNGKHWKKDFDWKIDSMAHQYDIKHRNDTQ